MRERYLRASCVEFFGALEVLRPMDAKELDGKLLSAEPSWFVLTCLRSNIVRNTIADGFAQLAKLVFMSFVQPGRDFRHGLQLSFHSGGQGFLCAQPSLLVSDEGAIRDCFASKGASGSLVCILCRTTVSKASTLARSSDRVVEHTELDHRKFILHNDATLRENHRHLEASHATMTKKQFKELQQMLGINYCPRGLVAMDTVQACGFSITDGLCYDWMHVYMVSGLFHLQVAGSCLVRFVFRKFALCAIKIYKDIQGLFKCLPDAVSAMASNQPNKDSNLTKRYKVYIYIISKHMLHAL